MPSGKTSFQTTTEIEFDYVEVLADLFAFRRKIATTSSNPKVEDNFREDQGLCHRKGITAMRAGLTPEFLHGFFIADEELKTAVARFGYRALDKGHFKALENQSFYDYFTNGGEADDLIRFESYDHSFWRADGRPLPTGIYFDYIEPSMDNLHYDLTKALDILSKRDDVFFFDKDLNVVEGKIESVPYYNRDSGRHAYLSFHWTPSQEQVELLREDKEKKGGYRSRYKTIFDHDMLGLRAGGAALYEDFYKSTEVNSDDDDDDY